MMQVLWMAHRDIGNAAAGGAEVLAFEVSRRLVRRGHQVAVLSGHRGRLASAQTLDGVTISRTSGWIGPHFEESKFLSLHPDADIVIDDLGHAIPWATPYISDLPVAPLFYHLHRRTLMGQVSPGTALILAGVESLYPAIYFRRRFLTISPSSKVDLVSLGVRPSEITVISPGVDLDLFTPRDISEDPKLVYFGGLRPYKRATHAIDVLRELTERGCNARLLIIGEGNQLADLRRQASGLQCKDRVEFAGRLSRSQLAEQVSSAWVNLHFSRSEGWCISALEAAASGVPTVGYSVPGIADSVQSGITGILVPDGNVHELANAVETVIRSRREWTERCRKWAGRFTWERCVDDWEEFLERTA